ncbi:MAG: gephyrin-like molybdotransferase Glp [Myxococcota bacterium]
MTKTLISVEQARDAIIERIHPLGPERVLLTDALGRTLAAPIFAPYDAPRFDNSARDGFAVRFADVASPPATLRVTETIHAGEHPRGSVGAGEAARIMTGAVVPDGADTIIMSEHCTHDGDTVTVRELGGTKEGDWVRKRASFMAAGDAVLRRAATLHAGDIVALAGYNQAAVRVTAKPVVAILSTGDELVELGQQPGPSQILNSNAYMLEALVRAHGATPLVLPIARDDREQIFGAYSQALQRADLIVSSGGVSVGAKDFVHDVLEELVGSMDFYKIRMRPGKPLAFGVAERGSRLTPLLGLPGNPASGFVCFHQFVRPALDVLSGGGASSLERVRATMSAAVPSTPKRRHYVTGRVRTTQAGLAFDPIPNQDSGNVLILCGVRAFAIIEEGVGAARSGDEVIVELI